MSPAQGKSAFVTAPTSPLAFRIFAGAEGEGTFGANDWQMTFGERAALIGLLRELRPSLAIEVGTAAGGSLEIIAAGSEEVHSFDLAPPPRVERFSNVTFHTGDSRILLPSLLEYLKAAGRNVDFVLVDGDHSADGVYLDVTQLLDSECIGCTVMLLHDPDNPEVRRGLERVEWTAYPKVQYVDFEAVPGRLLRSGPFAGQTWRGLGLVLIDSRAAPPAGSPLQSVWCDTLPMIQAFLDNHHAETEALLDSVLNSMSWRVTAPLRWLGKHLRRLTR